MKPNRACAVDGDALQFRRRGRTLMLAPGADPSDGKLDVVLAGDLERWEGLTRIIPGLGDGSYLTHPKVSTASRDTDQNRKRSYGPRRCRRRKHRPIANVACAVAVPPEGGDQSIVALDCCSMMPAHRQPV